MKTVLSLTLIFAILSSATVGCLVIFEIMTVEGGMGFLYKTLAAIVLIGAASALITAVTGGNSTSKEE